MPACFLTQFEQQVDADVYIWIFWHWFVKLAESTTEVFFNLYFIHNNHNTGLVYTDSPYCWIVNDMDNLWDLCFWCHYHVCLLLIMWSRWSFLTANFCLKNSSRLGLSCVGSSCLLCAFQSVFLENAEFFVFLIVISLSKWSAGAAAAVMEQWSQLTFNMTFCCKCHWTLPWLAIYKLVMSCLIKQGLCYKS